MAQTSDPLTRLSREIRAIAEAHVATADDGDAAPLHAAMILALEAYAIFCARRGATPQGRADFLALLREVTAENISAAGSNVVPFPSSRVLRSPAPARPEPPHDLPCA